MSIRTKIIGAIVATALVAPPTFAVEGTDGMYYTSAAEGFYASIRARFNTGDSKDGLSSVVDDAGSRFGLQGTGEMSHGLEGFYRYELRVPDTGDNVRTGISFVGLRGGFGEIRLGNWDLVEHDWVTARTDYTNNGNRPGTWNLDTDQNIQYKSPNFNGLQVGAAFRFSGGTEASGETGLVHFYDNATGEDLGGSIVHPKSDLDSWTIAGNYAFSGFNLGGAYSTLVDGVHMVSGGALVAEGAAMNAGEVANVNVDGFDDLNLWGISGSYGQDNWQVGAFYKKDNMSDKGSTPDGVTHDDQSYFSVAGQVDVGKTRAIVTHDTRDNSAGHTDTATTFEVEYRLNSQAKVWVGYTASDYDTDTDAEDDVYFGLRHDF